MGALDGKASLIMGAGSGVGRASALLWAAEGAQLVCADIREDWVNDTVALVEKQGQSAVPVVCDVTKEADVVAAIEAAVDAYGRLDVIFNNVGIATPQAAGPFETYTDEMWDLLMNVNFRGVFYGMKHAVLQFKAQEGPGAIVNTGSAAGLVGWGGTVYGSSKGGVIQMTRAVAIEAAAAGIRVNAIAPGAMATNFGVWDDSQAFADKPAALLEGMASLHPNGRATTPEDCAAAAMFLASDAAIGITGVILPVDGGYTAR
jgi:NAD(P)-dependent dehydrogenase (short-subunit alcohol dehydrogenase family)